MSKSAQIELTGQSRKELLGKLERIRAWDNGHNYPIEVWVNQTHIMDTIENVENAIKENLVQYINENFKDDNKCLKSGGNDDLYLVDNPDISFGADKFKKRKNVVTNRTPKKKKRKK